MPALSSTPSTGKPNLTFSPRVPTGLPVDTPAWTTGGEIHLGPGSLGWSPAQRGRLLRHELAHSVHQSWAPPGTSLGAREHAEMLAGRAERGAALSLRDVLAPAPDLLAYPPKPYKPFDQVWIGYPGIVGEVVTSGVTVRFYKDYDELGIGVKGRSDYWAYECGKHDTAPLPDIAKKMKDVGEFVARLNKKIPAVGAAHRVALVAVHGGSASAGYRTAHGKGMVVLPVAEFDTGKFGDTLAHEVTHGIFEHHLRAGPRAKGAAATAIAPDPLALRFAELYLKLEATEAVPEPTARFDPKSPPPLSGDGPAHPAGLVMVTDTLWAAEAGGHPWHGVDEFFASAYAAFVRQPKLLKKIVKHYGRHDKSIGPLAKELFLLLRSVGKPKKLSTLAAPSKPGPAERELSGIGATPDFTGKTGRIGWLVEPSRMPAPDRIRCEPLSVDPRSIEELLGIDDLPDVEEETPEAEREPAPRGSKNP
ncbi:MAG: hypothetical protein HKM89_05600 [Gemmatimonadales bacterium]|nr:hypothetical protein [Gemmatimonadales bacterium]